MENANKFVSTGSIYIMDKIQKVFVITTASTFLHSYESYGSPHFEYAKKSTLFLARDGENDYWVKTPLL